MVMYIVLQSKSNVFYIQLCKKASDFKLNDLNGFYEIRIYNCTLSRKFKQQGVNRSNVIDF